MDIVSINRTLKSIIIISSIFLVGMSIVLWSFRFETTTYNYLHGLLTTIPYLTGAYAGFINWKYIGTKSYLGKSLFYTGLALASYGFAMFFWSYYNFFSDIEIPYPSVADILFIFMTPALIMGLIYIIKIFEIRLSRDQLLKTGIMFFVIGAAVIFILGLPEFTSELGFWENFFNLSYSLNDAILVATAVTGIQIIGGRISKGISIYFIGFFSIIIADVLFSYRIAKETYWNGDIADVFYVLTSLFLGVGIIMVAQQFMRKINS